MVWELNVAQRRPCPFEGASCAQRTPAPPGYGVAEESDQVPCKTVLPFL